MTKKVLCLLALGVVAACDSADHFGKQLAALVGAQRIAGTGDLTEPRFAASNSAFLTFTDGGRPSLVFLVNAANLETAPVSFRPLPPGSPSAGAFVPPNDDSSTGSVDGSTLYAVFLSQASDLLEPGSGVPFFRDSTQVFVKNLATGGNSLVSAAPDGLPANHDVTSAVISGNGRYVAFATRATNLVDPATPVQAPNGASQVYVRDLFAGTLELISTTGIFAPGTGDSTDPAITPDGRYVAFRSLASNLVGGDAPGSADVFLYDRATRMVVLSTVGTAFLDAAEPAVSQDGMVAAFSALDGAGVRQVYAHDRSTGTTTNLSAGGTADSWAPSLSGDGRFVAFASDASNLLPPGVDTEGFTDVFVFDRATGLIARASVSAGGPGGGDGDSWQPTLSADGQYLAYLSEAENVAPDDPLRAGGSANGLADLIIGLQPFATP